MLGLRSLIHKASSVGILVSSNYAKFFVENPVSSDSVANQKGTMSSLGRLNPLRDAGMKIRFVAEDRLRI